MLTRKKVYICDHCGAVALEETYSFFGDTWKGAPEGCLGILIMFGLEMTRIIRYLFNRKEKNNARVLLH